MILALAVSVAAPALMPALEATRGEAGARRVASFLDDVRRRAVLERRVLTVRYDQEGERLVVLAQGGAGKEAPSPFTLPEGVSVVSLEPEAVEYLPQGYASGAVVRLRDPAGREWRVEVGAFTGLSRLARGENAPRP